MLATIPFEMIRASRQYTNQLVKHLIEALVKYPENLREKKIQGKLQGLKSSLSYYSNYTRY